MSDKRLASARSLYLRQHADDPVDWHVWGAEASLAARERDVPIFLSSGYSACHWCHVMHDESFRDPETAQLLNERFVPVKVDRELRPDVDSVYIDYVTASTGHGGWPMSVFLAPDLTPLFGATYLPAVAQGRLPSFRDVLNEIDAVYQAGGERLSAVRDASMAFLREQASRAAVADIDREAIDRAAELTVRFHDRVNGGFGDAPKFPQAPLLQFLCAYHALAPDPEIVFVVETTVSAMLRGGVYDQVGGGLFRYSTDAAWTVPHFEKMLYDSGQLLRALAAASRVISDPALLEECQGAARQTAAFFEREMSLEGGGLAASLSADQGGVEGAFYTWTYSELASLLSAEELATAVSALGARPEAPDDPQVITRRAGRETGDGAVDGVLAKLAAARDARPRPERDDKLVCAWNALAACGLMEAGAAFADERMSAYGLSTLRAVADLCATDTGVLRVPDDPSVADVRIVDDATLLASACLTAFDTTGSPDWLDAAVRLHSGALDAFFDGTFVFMVSDASDLPVRPREQGDEPTPSGAATLADNAVRLAVTTGEERHLETAATILRSLWMLADFAPEHSGAALRAATRLAAL